MTKIKTVYLISHTHTDIGYTDHQTALFRQHIESIDRAIELCEATADYPPEAQYRWTCEVAGIVEKYVQTRPAKQIDRLVRLNQQGRIAVAAMAYNWSPLLSPAGMVRSLYPTMRLRRDYGFQITSAMQCDVNGASWLWADMLPAIGIRGLTMSINTHRGRRPMPVANTFWWEGPGGRRLLTFNGPHYALGIIFYGMGSIGHAEAALPALLQRLEQDHNYPYDFLYLSATHPNSPDNGFPYGELSDFVRNWNTTGHEPQIVFTTVDGFIDLLNQRWAASAPTWRGDWTDWWADGAASSAYETSVARTTEALLPALDLLATQVDNLDLALIEQAYQSLALYDEHSWGAFNSIFQPHQPFVRAQFNQKASYAYNGYTLTHELLARGGRKFCHVSGLVPEGDVIEKWLPPGGDPEPPKEEMYLVINSLGWSRDFCSIIPPDGLSTAPYHFLDAHFIPNYRDSYPQSIGMPEPITSRPGCLRATLPPFSFQFITPLPAIQSDFRLKDGQLENQWYKIEVDPQTGGLRSWYDKEIGCELAATRGVWRLGQYVYESVDSAKGRQAIFGEDFTTEQFGKWMTNTPFRRQWAVEVTLGPVQQTETGQAIEVFLDAPGAHSVRVRYSLPNHQKALFIDVVIDKVYEIRPESIYIMFPFTLQKPKFHLDLNGVPLAPDIEQLPGSCRDWYSIQRWGEVGDEKTSIVVVPIDAPLMQIGGIQTGRAAERLDVNDPTLVSWPVQNHWTTNFQAGQTGELLCRYRLSSMKEYDPAVASRFAADYLVPPIIVRAFGEPGKTGQFMTVSPEGVADVQLKRADDGRGLIVRAFGLTAEPQQILVHFPLGKLKNIIACSPIEEDGDPINLTNDSFLLDIPARSVAQARVIFE